MDNIDKLQQYQSFSSYRQLCKFLDEPIKTGGAKINQLKDWQRYFEFLKDGNKLIITDIYDEPLPEAPKVGNNSKYIEHIKVGILYNLYEATQLRPDVPLEINMTQLMEIVGIVNQKYGRLKNSIFVTSNLEKDLQSKGVRPYMVNVFYKMFTPVFKQYLITALESLVDSRTIFYTYQYKILTEDEMGDSGNYLIHSASDQEIESILEVERTTLREFEAKDEIEIILRNKVKEYYNKNNAKMNKKFGWKGYYKSLKIITNSEILLDEMSLDKNQAILNKLNLNEKIVEMSHKKIDKVVDKNQEKQFQQGFYEEGNSFFMDETLRKGLHTLVDYGIEISEEEQQEKGGLVK